VALMAALNQTPCPDWCNIDHALRPHHGVTIAEGKGGEIRLFLWPAPGLTPSTALHLVVHLGAARFWIHAYEPIYGQAEELADLLAAVGKPPKWLTEALGKVDETADLMRRKPLERAS
jgi:hypothetical protein